MEIKRYKSENIEDVIDFEKRLRFEDDMGWEIDDKYIEMVKKSFRDDNFKSSVSLLYYIDKKVYGRVDSALIFSHFDGSCKAYLDWICVLPSFRGKGIARALMKDLRHILKNEYNIQTLIGLMDKNDECRRFYSKLEDSVIKDEGIWIDL